MSEIKPKKERRFLKTLGRVGEILVEQVLLKLGSSIIRKIGGKKTLPSILFLLASLSLLAQYPNTGNKQRLGFQTTGDGLVYRGRSSDTVAIKSSGLNNAYFILDTVNNIQYNYIKTKGGWVFSNGDTIIINNNFTQPVDSLFFNVNVPTNNVDTAKMRWDSDLATVVLGLNDNVPNELGFKNFWLVKNQTGSTITKGSLVYANGTLGASGRITVAKFIANGSIDAKYLLGITAHDLSNGEDGYVISFGKIRKVNTDTFAAGAILYPSPTVAGVWTDVEPIAPNIDMPIGFCINSSSNNGTIAIRVASGYKLSELHDLAISSPIDRASLYYSGGLWRDTTAALLTSDTASMLTPYLRTGVAAGTYLPLTGGTMTGTINRQEGSHDGSTSTFYYNILNYFAKQDNIKYNPTAQITFTDRPGTLTFENVVRTSDIHLMTAKNFNGSSLGQYLDTTLSVVANQDGGRVGISKLNPAYKLDVNGTFNASGASLIGGTLGVSGATNISNTLNATIGTFTGLNVNNTNVNGEGVLSLKSYNFNFANRIQFGDGAVIRREIIYPNSSSNMQFRSYTVGGSSGGYDFYVSNGSTESLAATIGTDKSLSLTGTLTGTTGNFSNNVAIGATTSNSKLTVYNGDFRLFKNHINPDTSTWYSNILFTDELDRLGARITGERTTWSGANMGLGFDTGALGVVARRMTITSSGNIGIGTTNPLSKFEVHGSAVFNEGSAIADFRVESDNNANMLFVDGTNNRVGIGTNAPTRTLEVNGTLNATGDITEGGLNVLTSSDTASLSTRIDARLNKSDTATMLNPYWRSGKFSGTLPIANGGTGAESASVARVTLGVGYIFTEVTAGSSVTLFK
jgi:hypothetical protein